MSAKYKELLVVSVKLEEKERVYAEISKRLEDTEALLTRAMKKLSEKKKIDSIASNAFKRKRKGKQGYCCRWRKYEGERSGLCRNEKKA